MAGDLLGEADGLGRIASTRHDGVDLGNLDPGDVEREHPEIEDVWDVDAVEGSSAAAILSASGRLRARERDVWIDGADGADGADGGDGPTAAAAAFAADADTAGQPELVDDDVATDSAPDVVGTSESATATESETATSTATAADAAGDREDTVAASDLLLLPADARDDAAWRPGDRGAKASVRGHGHGQGHGGGRGRVLALG
nr:hypothetical protein [Micromonospora sp. DSM 115978]